MKSNYLDKIGSKHGRLIILRKFGRAKGKILFECKCDCGTIKVIRGDSLISGDSKSCGCLLVESARRQGKNNRIEYGLAVFNEIYATYKQEARKRNYDFNLTRDEFKSLTKQNCFYCGTKPSNIKRRKDKWGEYVHNGIDRKDNNSGYTLDNCVASCKRCNQAKNDMTIDDFLEWINRVYNYNFIDTNLHRD